MNNLFSVSLSFVWVMFVTVSLCYYCSFILMLIRTLKPESYSRVSVVPTKSVFLLKCLFSFYESVVVLGIQCNINRWNLTHFTCIVFQKVLSNEATRTQYDRALKLQENSRFHRVKRHSYTPEVEDAMKYYYTWSEKRQRSRHGRFYGHYSTYPNSHFYAETEPQEEEGVETAPDQRDSFVEALKSAFLSMFLLYTFGCLASLTFSTFTALLDKELDMGYKVGFMIAWILGGKGGILLTLCLTFASWLCGKASSSVVVLVLVAMWVGSNLARHAPLPQGALLTLLYMSIKLQVDSTWIFCKFPLRFRL